jgi:hypothetical protein
LIRSLPQDKDFRWGMRVRFSLDSFDLLHLAVFASIVVLVLTHIPVSYDNYKIRNRVRAGFEEAKPAMNLVVVNALEKRNLAHGWVDSVAGNTEGIRVDPHTGIITINYPMDIDGGGKSLVLMPMYLQEYEIYPLVTHTNSNLPIAAAAIHWACTSSLTQSKRNLFTESHGTLSSKYAPVECRLPWTGPVIAQRYRSSSKNL